MMRTSAAVNFGDARLSARFWALCVPEPNSGCWLWTGSVNEHGYARVRPSGAPRAVLGHRFAYAALVGPIPEGLVCDHLCRTRSCVNPLHLEPVSNRENILRGECRAAMNAVATTCAHGHAFTEENTLIRSDGAGRECRACAKARCRASRARRRASSSNASDLAGAK